MNIKFGKSKRVRGISYVVVTLDGDYIGELMRDHTGSPDGAVSYTHLTLPTILLV